MTPRFVIAFFVLLSILVITASAQQASAGNGETFITVQPQLQSKLADGRLVLHASRMLQNASSSLQGAAPARMMVAVYADREPAQAELDALAATGAIPYPGTWTPPMANHPRGFYLAAMQPARLNEVLALDCVRQLGAAEGANRPLNNVASRSIRATAAWSQGWTGKNVKVGVLDSGIDTSYQNGEFPSCFDRKNYSKFPAIDDDVINRITPHGTHVTGTAVGRGILSANNTGNEGGAYRGMAPEACLAFIKIGDDSSAGASDAVIIGALNDMVTKYHARVINLSYGGWSTYHDGSEALEQKADWAYTQGAAVVFAAGNSATGARHAMGTVPANGESDFIEVHSWNIAADQSRLSFNLVWFDGIGVQRKLSLRYFDTNKVEITDLNVAPMTESARGTQSQYSSMKPFMKAGNSTFFLKVVNSSAAEQVYHIYEDWYESTWKNQGNVTFSSPSSAYTICGPSTADHALSIAAYCDRSYWTGAQGWMNTYYQSIDKLASWSSRGPRVDNWPKPDIAAPGTALISVRDTNMSHVLDNNWVDDDGIPGGPAHYQPMQGTSMATPVATGAVAVVLSKYPLLTPQQVYDSLRAHAVKDVFTGATPNNNWGVGKLDLGFLSGLPDRSSSVGWEELKVNWGAKEVAAIAVGSGATVFATVGKPFSNDSTTLLKSDDFGRTWTPLLSDVGLVALALPSGPVDSSMYSAQRFNGRLYRSDNRGNTWAPVGQSYDYTAVTFAFSDSLVVAATYGQGILYSSDHGVTWNPMNGGIPGDAQVPILQNGKNGWLFACIKRNNVVQLHRLQRTGMTWLRADYGIDTTKHINAITVMQDGTLFAAVSDRIYRSEDNGASWTQVAILNDYIQSLSASTNSTVHAGTVSAGIYRSNDRGLTWSAYNDGLTTLNIVTMNMRQYGWKFAAGKPGSLFRRQIRVPAEPKPIFPADSAIDVPQPVKLTWQQNSNASSVEVSLDSTCANPLYRVDGVPYNTWNVSKLPNLTTVFWRVRGESEDGMTAWSKISRFTTSEPPPPIPLQTAPVDNSDSLKSPVHFTWLPSQGATKYRVDIAIDSALIIRNSYWVTKGLSYDDSTLKGSTRFFWRIRAENAGGVSEWSPTWRFSTAARADTSIDSSKILTIPTMQTPHVDERNFLVNGQFIWLPSANALSYQIQIARDTSFTPPLVDLAANLTSYRANALPYYTRLYWRLRAKYAAGWSEWSLPRSFVTTMAGPVLKTPKQYATDVHVNTFLTWDSTAGATSYRLQVAKDQAWGVPFLDTTGVAALQYRVLNLSTSTTYYWRVFGINADGQGENSAEWQFVTSPNTGVTDPIRVSAFLLEHTYPNPASEQARVRFHMRKEADVTLRVYDLFGREVLSSLHAQLTTGTHEVSLDVHSLVAGVYLLRVSDGTSIIEQPLTILR